MSRISFRYFIITVYTSYSPKVFYFVLFSPFRRTSLAFVFYILSSSAYFRSSNGCDGDARLRICNCERVDMVDRAVSFISPLKYLGIIAISQCICGIRGRGPGVREEILLWQFENSDAKRTDEVEANNRRMGGRHPNTGMSDKCCHSYSASRVRSYALDFPSLLTLRYAHIITH